MFNGRQVFDDQGFAADLSDLRVNWNGGDSGLSYM